MFQRITYEGGYQHFRLYDTCFTADLEYHTYGGIKEAVQDAAFMYRILSIYNDRSLNTVKALTNFFPWFMERYANEASLEEWVDYYAELRYQPSNRDIASQLHSAHRQLQREQ